MLKSLYDIRIEHAAIVDELIDSEGEITDEIAMALAINEDELTEKAEAYALRILEFEGQATVVDIEIKRLQKRKQSFEKTAAHLKDTIKAAMLQFKKDKIKTDKVTLSFRKSEVVEVPETWADDILKFVSIKAELNEQAYNNACIEAGLNNADMPEQPTEDVLQYFKLSATVDKTKMKASLKEGLAIDDNIMLLTKQNLQIK